MSATPAIPAPTCHPFIRLGWRAATPLGLVVLFSAGLLVRLLIAPHAGYYADLKIFQAWAQRLAMIGPQEFYGEQWADYPPGYLYILWLLGKISTPPGFVLLKMPAILGDLALAWVAGTFAGRLAPALAQRVPLRPLVAAAVLFNPAVLMVGALWGQVDVVPAIFVLASLMLLFTGRQSLARESAAFLVFAVAITMKPQSGFVLPVMLYALYRRYARDLSRSEVSRLALHFAVPGALALALWLLVAVPFGLGPVELLRFYREASSGYPVTSAFAFNLWGAVGFNLPDVAGVTFGDGERVPGDAVQFASVSALHLGMVLVAAGAAVALWRAHRAIERGGDEPLVLTVAAAGTSLLAFSVLTRMHERYMFYALAFFAPLVFIRPLRFAYTALSGLYVVNLWWPYAYNNSRGDLGHDCALPFPGCFGIDPLLGGFAFDAWQKKAYSAAVVAIAVGVVWFGADWAARQRSDTRADARLDRPGGSRASLR
jgi:dolichyl-phosphate-mannose-protein mannosyltransferase